MLKKLNREQVRAAIHHKGPTRPPLANALVFEPVLMEEYGEEIAKLRSEFPDDIVFHNVHVDYWEGTEEDPGYTWAFGGKKKPEGVAIDACPLIDDWGELDQFIAEMPSPEAEKPFNEVRGLSRSNPDTYCLVAFGHYSNQKLSSIRGIHNLLLDFYDHKEELKRILNAFLEYYEVLARRMAEAGAHGITGGDDFGHQKALFMPPDIFREIYKPFHAQLGDILHSNGLDYWQHSCGNIVEIMPDLIECGIDVLHPIQVGTMDDKAVVDAFSGQITFHVGMDVQHLIPFGTPDEVRKGIRERAELFYRKEGGVIFGTGNVVCEGTPIENVQAYIEELASFLEEKRLQA